MTMKIKGNQSDSVQGVEKVGVVKEKLQREEQQRSPYHGRSPNERGRNEDSYVPSTHEEQVIYKPNREKKGALHGNRKEQVGAFQRMVELLFEKQMALACAVMQQWQEWLGHMGTQQFAEEAENQALQMLAELEKDAMWGMDAVASRIVEFGKHVLGGDPSQNSLMKDAVDRGFDQIEKAWMFTLPSPTKKTYLQIQFLFGEWEKEALSKAVAEET